MITETTFQPQKPTTRFRLVLALCVICVVALLFFLYANSRPLTETRIIRSVVFFAGTLFALVALARSKAVNSVTVDSKKKELIVSYISLFKNETVRHIPFSDITYEYKLIEGRYGEYTVLRISVNYKKEFSIAEAGGWSREMLDNLHAQLESSSI